MEACVSALTEFMNAVPKYIKVSFGITITGTLAVILYRKITTKPRKIYPSDTIVLYQIGRGPYVPSLTPFAVKLETYLRMAKIPYVNEHGSRMSAKGKVPFIEHNGEEISDSAFCIKYINKAFNVDLNRHLNEEQRAVAHAWRKTLEENTYWTVALDRWVFNDSRKVLGFMGYPSFLQYFARRAGKKSGWAHGIGRHSQEEVYEIMKEDFKNLSVFLGKKKFLLGDEPCEEDCAVFGLLSQTLWHSFGNPAEKILEGYPNLCSYCQRMKETFWPDWDDCITHGGTREATS